MDLNTLTKILNIEGYKVVELPNCNQRFILFKNKNKLNEKQKGYLDKLYEINIPIYKVMLLKESFLEVYIHERVEEAKECLENWIKQALSSGLDVFIQLGYKFQEKMEYILNWFYKKVSSAISEGFNNKIKRLKRMAYGYIKI